MDQIPLQGAPGFAGAGQGLDEDIGEFVRAVNAVGFSVSLVEAAQWGTVVRDDVRRWLASERADLSKIPLCLAGKKTEGTAPRGTPAPGGIAALPVLVAHEMSYSDHPVLADHGPRESAPARVPKKRDAVPEKQEHERDAEEVFRDPDENRPLPRAPEVSDQYATFIETVLAEVDLEAEYTELEAALEVGEERRDYTTINAEVDKAQRRAQRANHLWGNVVVEHERLKLDQKEVDADLWKRAMAKLEAEGSKTRIADVDAKIAEMFPDEWREGKLRVKKSEIAVERAKSFQERWSSRERALVAMLQAVRK